MLKQFSFMLTPVFIASIFSFHLPQALALKTLTNSVPPQSLLTSAQPNLTDSSVVQKERSAKKPKIGKVETMIDGDLMCYVTLIDENNVKQESIGADFDLCANQNKYLNRQVKATYELVNVNDCQSFEPCDKTRQEWLITQMEMRENSSSNNSQTLTNGEWTIKIDNLDSWSGVNGTGNLRYYGCDSSGSCLSLNGGQMTCREGICTMVWRNDEYTYIIDQLLDNPERPTKSAMGSVLIVRQGEKIILRATGLKPTP